jgi:hypothetical protein
MLVVDSRRIIISTYEERRIESRSIVWRIALNASQNQLKYHFQTPLIFNPLQTPKQETVASQCADKTEAVLVQSVSTST